MPDRSSPHDLNREQHRQKERILTQHDPAKVRKSADAVVLKQGSVFFLSEESGDVPWARPHGYGLFFEDCRFLDGYRLSLNGQDPTALSADDTQGFETQHHLTNPDMPQADGDGRIAKNTIALRRQRLMRGAVLHELIALRNHGLKPARLRLELRFRANFEDLFDLKGFVRARRGTLHDPRIEQHDRVVLRYDGLDGHRRTTALMFAPAPDRLEPDRAVFELKLDQGEAAELTIGITPSEHRPGDIERTPAQPGASAKQMRRWLERSEGMWIEHAAEVRSSNPLFERVLRRALLDLRLLRSQLDGKHYFAAGVPWFVTLFGRDAATVAIQTMPYGPAMAHDTLRLLAAYQARDFEAYRDAEPGKILHEFRSGELAQRGVIPQSPAYYGTVDATMLFLILLAEYVNWSGRLDLARELRRNVDRALEWMARHADHDGDGFLDYVGAYETGLINQGWKDSGNAVIDAQGRIATPPIALCEVQAYAFRAWRQSARLLRLLGDAAAAEELDGRADRMRERFERTFWSEQIGCYLMALQQGGRPIEVASSNSGQVLWGGIARPERADRVRQRLLAPDMFSGWGIRTLSSQAAGYNPMSYHLGSVWPHDNALILAGFCRYGHKDAALRVFDALFEAAANLRGQRLPELFCGFDRVSNDPRPVPYPVACRPQAWAAGALPHALWNLLGLRADALANRLLVMRPRLPTWLDWVELRGLPFGGSHLDLRFERTDESGRATLDVARNDGGVEVVVGEELTPPDTYHCGDPA